MFDASAMAQGFVLGLAMFVSPGPKDVLILRQSLLRRPAAELIAVGTLSDALLIWLGMAGASAALNRAPALQVIALWIGVSLLLVPGLLAARRALLVVSFLNPVAWLDTVLVIGMVGAAWLGGVALALVGYGVLHQFAVAPKPEVLQPGQMAGFVGRTMVASLAFYGQYVWPVLCLAAALVSFFRRQARGPGG